MSGERLKVPFHGESELVFDDETGQAAYVTAHPFSDDEEPVTIVPSEMFKLIFYEDATLKPFV